MTKKIAIKIFLIGAFALGLIANHSVLLNQPDDWASPLALLDRLFDLGLTGIFALTALGVGQRILRALGWASDSIAERIAFSFGVGTSALSLILILIGLARVLYAPVILGLLMLACALTAHDWRALCRDAHNAWRARAPFARAEKLLVIALGALLVPILLGALTPPTDVDALNYHLVAPALFLKQHAVVPSFDNIGVNYPVGVDILYLFGLAAGTDLVAQLIHFSFALAVSIGVYAFAAQHWTRTVGILAGFIFWSSSVVGLSASMPLLDLGLTVYEFLALWSFFRWRASHQDRELFVLGMMLGGALASKYLAAVVCVLLGALIVVESVRQSPRNIFKHAFIVAGSAALIAAPWYIKNWIWLTSPLYPLFSGDYGLDGTLHPPSGYLGGVGDWTGLGLGTDWFALLTFPINIYLKWDYFGSPLNRGGPSLFFLFLPFYFFVRKHSIANWLWLICALRFAFWWEHTQNIRYLIAIFPLLAILSACVIGDLVARARVPLARVPLTVALVLFGTSAIILEWGFLFVLRENALPFIAGKISRAQYLEANLLNYPVTRFINARLSNAHILALGDQRIYYIQPYVNPDDPHRNWLEWLAIGKTAEGMARFAREQGITHLWVSQDDLKYFRNYVGIDSPYGASAAVFEELRARALEQIYADERGHIIYALRR